VFGCQLAHFTGADQHDGLVGEVAQYFFRQFHGGKRHGNSGRSYFCFGAHTLGNRKSLVKKAIENNSGRFEFSSIAVGSFYLPQNLRFTDHH
jgi:hypothetical protein